MLTDLSFSSSPAPYAYRVVACACEPEDRLTLPEAARRLRLNERVLGRISRRGLVPVAAATPYPTFCPQEVNALANERQMIARLCELG